MHTTHCTLCTDYYKLHSIHCTLHTAHYTLHNPKMSNNFIFLLEILSKYVTRIFIICDYPCGKGILDIVYSGTVINSFNGAGIR